MTDPKLAVFSTESVPKLLVSSPKGFLLDIQKTCSAINASQSESVIRSGFTAYLVSPVTHHEPPWDSLNFCFCERSPVDCNAMAVAPTFLPADNPLGLMMTSLSSLYDGKPEQSCHFDAWMGLTKTWIVLGGKCPLDDILRASHVPKSICGLGSTFQELGLNMVHHVSVDYHFNTVNIYFASLAPSLRRRLSSWLV